MRDPKTHAKVLALRWKAVGRALNLASLRDDFFARRRLTRLHRRVTAAMDHHRDKTGWGYVPPTRRSSGFWTYTETDTEEAPDA